MNLQEQSIAETIKRKVHEKNPDAEIIIFGSHARGEGVLL